MPNWVYNDLTITDLTGGTHADRLASLVKQVGASYHMMQTVWSDGGTKVEPVERSEPFSFWNIVKPEDEELDKWIASLSGPGGSPYWYNWNNEHWGTKWDTSEVTFMDHLPNHVSYHFETAWSPPLTVLASLSAQYPELHIELEWEEENGFGGTFVFTNGEVEETNSYDIPNSHADHVDRDKTCPCEDWGPEDAFPDCPSWGSTEGKDSFRDDELEIEVLT